MGLKVVGQQDGFSKLWIIIGSIVLKYVYYFIATFVDISTFYINYLAMHKVRMHAGAIRKLLYGLRFCVGNNPLATACGLSSLTYARTIHELDDTQTTLTTTATEIILK